METNLSFQHPFIGGGTKQYRSNQTEASLKEKKDSGERSLETRVIRSGAPIVAATSAFARSTGSYGQAAELACGSSEERVFCKASFLKAAMAPRGLMMRSARRADRLGGMEVLQESRTPGEAVDYIIITLRQRHSEQTCGGIREKASGRKKLVENTKI
ncbi:unnamed protein product [Arctogadus glacialis]